MEYSQNQNHVLLSDTGNRSKIHLSFLLKNKGADLRARLGPFFLLALWGKEVIGFVAASLHEAAPGEMAIFRAGGRYLEIDELYVLPAYREQAIGTNLMQAVVQEARRQGIEHFSVYSSTKQWRSITAFYEQLGFQMWFVRMFH